MLDLGGDLVGEEARDERRDRRHDEDRARREPEAGRDGQHPQQRVQRRLQARPAHALDIAGAMRGEPGEQPVQADGHQDQQQDREPDRLEQHRAEWRCEHLGKGFEGGVEHGAQTVVASVTRDRAGTSTQAAAASGRVRTTPLRCGAGGASRAAGQASRPGLDRRRLLLDGRQRQVGPVQPLVLEAVLDGRLHHGEIGRDVEIARRIERVMADLQHLAPRHAAFHARHLRQDRIAHRLRTPARSAPSR